MNRICRITPRASQDIEAIIEAIADFLATHSSLASAESFLIGIDATLNRVAQFPQIGRKRDELYPGLRSLPYKQYLIFYRLLDDVIEVFRIISGYQDVTVLFAESE
ncbi:type II toxin-antitoxin system RelE/ParE family toxin [Halomicronema sp. CCY15110]|uniref:type II toxin-antitoxin system RelE/ParE family toxin n=1 Tax=Halomicronema sp. CCY15110 TaxID=2767773 RepID=UPI00194FDAFD|nr:type II toxin-antitoxin system RelE/ParE family toxin [Halomicronema sp. CCY15110]